MIVQLPPTVAYPVTVSRLLKQTEDDVPRLTPLLLYTFRTTVVTYPEFGKEELVEQESVGQFDAPVEGRIVRWLVKPGDVVKDRTADIIEIEEPCTHEVQFSGLCGICGKDMTEVDYNSYYISNRDRATIQLSHDNAGLTVSQDEARRLEDESKRRLLKQRKLSLVVDLDQTIIHATVDPTVGEWKDDPYCINHDLVKDVQAFKLDEDVSGGRGTWYYVKMRPGLKEFLQRISEKYELHIYTMGTRAYAMAVKKIVDPNGTVFGERVLSRDESGSMTQKNLHRLFPVDTKMVVIIDDRGDVWKWCDNLVKVRPYDFFVGIGDINSMFLPKRQDFPAATSPHTSRAPALPDDVPAEKGKEKEQGLGNAEATASAENVDVAPIQPVQLSTLEALVTMGSGDDKVLLSNQTEQLDKAIELQKEARPLAKKQEAQDKIDEEEAAKASAAANGHSHTPSEGGTQKHSVLQDNDYELTPLQNHLLVIHQKFYEDYDKNRGLSKDRVSQLRDASKHPRKRSVPDDSDVLDINAVPDVVKIMPAMKHCVLDGVVIVFSGIIPLGADIQSSDIATWVKSFGARVHETVSSLVTHVVAQRTRTAKVRQALRYPHIKLVALPWVLDSMSEWMRKPEEPYLIDIHPEDRPHGRSSPSLNGLEENNTQLLSSEDDDSDDGDYDSEFPVSSQADGGDNGLALDMSNVGWKDVDEEFAEFFGDDGFSDESDSESARSIRTDIEVTKRKRENRSGESDASVSESGDEIGSRLVKRQKIAKDRAEAGSSLKSVETPPGNTTPLNDEDRANDSDSLAEDLERELFALEEGDDEEDAKDQR